MSARHGPVRAAPGVASDGAKTDQAGSVLESPTACSRAAPPQGPPARKRPPRSPQGSRRRNRAAAAPGWGLRSGAPCGAIHPGTSDWERRTVNGLKSCQDGGPRSDARAGPRCPANISARLLSAADTISTLVESGPKLTGREEQCAFRGVSAFFVFIDERITRAHKS